MAVKIGTHARSTSGDPLVAVAELADGRCSGCVFDAHPGDESCEAVIGDTLLSIECISAKTILIHDTEEGHAKYTRLRTLRRLGVNTTRQTGE